MDHNRITTGRIGHNHLLARVGLAAAVLLVAVTVGAGAAPAVCAPATDASNGSFVASNETVADSPGFSPGAKEWFAPTTDPGDDVLYTNDMLY